MIAFGTEGHRVRWQLAASGGGGEPQAVVAAVRPTVEQRQRSPVSQSGSRCQIRVSVAALPSRPSLVRRQLGFLFAYRAAPCLGVSRDLFDGFGWET